MVWIFLCRGKLGQHSHQPSCHLSAWWMHVKDGQGHRVVSEMYGHKPLSKLRFQVKKKKKNQFWKIPWSFVLIICSQFSWQISFQDQNYMLICQRQLQGTLLSLWGIFRWLLQPASCGADGKVHQRILIIDRLRLGVIPGKNEKGDEWTRWLPNVNRYY